MRIRFNQAATGIGTVRGGLPIKAIMYFNDDILMIRPKENGFFNGLFNINLPLVFIREVSFKKNISIFPLRMADKIKISSWNSITIKYKKPGVSYSIQINFLSKDDHQFIEPFRIWEK
ncbi:MAG: hypothetical protein GQ527_11945 [Bacteroidales bacterium]|nr:hypothetical protein [Bacteroidales bacterium]